MASGRFITFEGGEGSGKTTQCTLLANRLKASGNEVVLTREPGGTEFAEHVREIILSGKAQRFGPFAEALLFSLAREDHLEKLIRPALEDGAWVVCDRFMDSTRAYQGAAQGIDQDTLLGFERIVVNGTRPHLTFFLDVPVETGLERARQRLAAQGDGQDADRFEGMDLAFHERLRQAFLEIAKAEPRRCIVLDGTLEAEEINARVWENILEAFAA